MATMLDGAHFEALAAVAFVSASPPPAFGHLLAAADRGVQVRLLLRADNLDGGLVQSLQSRGVDLGTLTDLHAKFLITDTTAMNGSANFTEASADRASEVATFFSPHTRPSCTICASCSTTTGSGRDPTDTAPANPRSLSENPIWVAAGRCPGWTCVALTRCIPLMRANVPFAFPCAPCDPSRRTRVAGPESRARHPKTLLRCVAMGAERQALRACAS